MEALKRVYRNTFLQMFHNENLVMKFKGFSSVKHTSAFHWKQTQQIKMSSPVQRTSLNQFNVRRPDSSITCQVWAETSSRYTCDVKPSVSDDVNRRCHTKVFPKCEGPGGWRPGFSGESRTQLSHRGKAGFASHTTRLFLN